MDSRNVWTCVCAFLLVAPAPAQAPPTISPQGNPAPLAAISTHLVQVNVAVRDRKGEPPTDLAKSAFQIYDNGVKQEISTLTLESTLSAPASSQAAPPLPVNTFTNRTELRPKQNCDPRSPRPSP